MKKRNFITGFSAAFVSTMALLSCGGIRAKDGVYLTINGKEYYAKDLYEGQQTPAAAEAKFNAVYKVAIRRYFEEGQEGYAYMTDITRDTKNKVAGAKAEAQSNADKNGTKYSDEWDKILSTNGVESESELYDKFEYDLEKEKFEDRIYERKYDTDEGKKGACNYDVLRDGGYLKNNKGEEIGKTEGAKEIPGYLKTKMPYHMKHILVKVSAKENDDLYGEISATEAEKICNIITALANGTSFEEIAKSTWNDDESARKNHGSLGIMSKDTEYVNDFKLGTYLFESFFAKQTKSSQTESLYDPTLATSLLFGTDQTEALAYATSAAQLSERSSYTTSGSQIGRIPYGVIENLCKTRDNTKLYAMDASSSRFSGISDVKAKYYPRNIIFNKYFNKHKIMVITNANKPEFTYDETGSAGYITGSTGSPKKGTGKDLYYGNNGGAAITGSAEAGKAGFKDSASIKNENDIDDFLGETSTNTKEQVLCDENGRIILVFRSGNGSSSSNDSSTYQGIHFIVIERSPFIGKEYDEGTASKENEKYTTLDEYYTQYYPDEINGHHPTYTDETTKNKRTFVNYLIGEETSALKERATTVKTELKKTDANLNTYVFDYLMNSGNITFNQSSKEAVALQTSITKWITDAKRNPTKKDERKNWLTSWETYYEKLELSEANRAYSETEGEKLVPEALVDVFSGEKSFTYSGGTFLLKDVFGKDGAYNV